MKKEDIILYDGVCILCNKWVSYIIKNDKQKRFKFASIQSKVAQNILKKLDQDFEKIDTIFLIKSNKIYTKFKASTYALYSINKIFLFIYFFNFVLPKSFLDFFYDFIGSRRYRFFGKYESCPIPDEKIKERFLDA